MAVYYQQRGPVQNSMILNGTGVVDAIPDATVIRLGVETTGERLEEVQDENARLAQSLLQSLNQLGITNIRTVQYSINRLFDFQADERIDRGYSVRNIFEIRAPGIDQAGIIIDAAVNNGANVVDFIDFDVTNAESYYHAALNLATRSAYRKAVSIGDDLGVNVNPIPLRITENTAVPFPVNTFLAREGTITPIEPGARQISASVTAEFLFY
jgi:uncharacterized protein YggE